MYVMKMNILKQCHCQDTAQPPHHSISCCHINKQWWLGGHQTWALALESFVPLSYKMLNGFTSQYACNQDCDQLKIVKVN